MIINTTMSST